MLFLNSARQELSFEGQQDTLWVINIGDTGENVPKNTEKHRKFLNNGSYLENEVYAYTLNYVFQIPRLKSFHLSGNKIGLFWYLRFLQFFEKNRYYTCEKKLIAHAKSSDKFMASFLP